MLVGYNYLINVITIINKAFQSFTRRVLVCVVAVYARVGRACVAANVWLCQHGGVPGRLVSLLQTGWHHYPHACGQCSG